eukprot:EG_transcript_10620
MKALPRRLISALRTSYGEAYVKLHHPGRPMASAARPFLQQRPVQLQPSDFTPTVEVPKLCDGLSTARIMVSGDANPAGNVHGGTILKLIDQAGFVVASRLCNRARSPGEPPTMGTLAQMFQMDFYLPMYVGELAKLYATPYFKPTGGVGVTVDVWAEDVMTAEVRHTNHAVLCYSVVHAETGEELVPCSELECRSPSLAFLANPNIDLPAVPPLPPDSFFKTSEDSTVHFAQLMLPGDCHQGTVVGGGVIMKMMDNAGGSCAFKHCRTNVVTVSIETLTFHGQAHLGDIVHVYARMVFTSTKSMDILVNVEVECLRTATRTPTTSGTFTFVSLDENHRPQPVPAFLPRTEEEIKLFHAHARIYEERRKRKARNNTQPAA